MKVQRRVMASGKRTVLGLCAMLLGHSLTPDDALAQPAAARSPTTLPGTLIYLRSIDPTIVQDIRYAGPNNFTGARVDSYDAPECILTLPAARALQAVQRDLAAQNLSLKVYDCYRPQRAVRAFNAWVLTRPRSADQSRYYHPRIERQNLIAAGYIAALSKHSIGNTVDLTLISLPLVETPQVPPAAVVACTAPVAQRLPDTSVDMGTGYDCFDVKSHTRADGLTAEQRRWRETLVIAMARRGYRNYAREWWHFSFGGDDDPPHDFPILPAPTARR